MFCKFFVALVFFLDKTNMFQKAFTQVARAIMFPFLIFISNGERQVQFSVF